MSSNILKIPGDYEVSIDSKRPRIIVSINDSLNAEGAKALIQQLNDSLEVLRKVSDLVATLKKIKVRPTPTQRFEDRRRKVPLDAYPSIFSRRERGEKYDDIAKDYPATGAAIYEIVKKHRPDLLMVVPQREHPNKPGKRQQPWKISLRDYEVIAKRAANGESLAALAEEYHVTRERIRQVVNSTDLYAIPNGKAYRRATRQEAVLVQAEVRGVQNALLNGPCVVCTGPVTSKKRATDQHRTCSNRCAKLWERCRLHLDSEEWRKHQQYLAQWNIDHLDPNDPENKAKLNHAKRVLDGTAGRHGNWTHPGSAAEKGLKEIEQLRAEVVASGESWWIK